MTTAAQYKGVRSVPASALFTAIIQATAGTQGLTSAGQAPTFPGLNAVFCRACRADNREFINTKLDAFFCRQVTGGNLQVRTYAPQVFAAALFTRQMLCRQGSCNRMHLASGTAGRQALPASHNPTVAAGARDWRRNFGATGCGGRQGAGRASRVGTAVSCAGRVCLNVWIPAAGCQSVR